MSKIIKYNVISEGSEDGLIRSVQQAITDKGWQPIGGVEHTLMLMKDDVYEQFSQALVMYEQ